MISGVGEGDFGLWGLVPEEKREVEWEDPARILRAGQYRCLTIDTFPVTLPQAHLC